MRTKGIQERVNTKAREVIEKARQDFGYTFEEISEICEVSLGSVQRWYTTGRAKANKIVHLEKLLENVRLSPEKIAENLIELYRFKKKRFCLNHDQLRKMAGRDRLSPKTIEKVQDELDDRGFMLLEEYIDGATIFLVIRRKWCFKRALEMNEEELKVFYAQKFDEELEGVEIGEEE